MSGEDEGLLSFGLPRSIEGSGLFERSGSNVVSEAAEDLRKIHRQICVVWKIKAQGSKRGR